MEEGPVDPGEPRLLPGEARSVRSGDIEDVRHWVAVYSELYGFKQRLLEEVGEQKKHVMEPGKSELANDLKLLQREADRLAGRLRYWQHELERRGAT